MAIITGAARKRLVNIPKGRPRLKPKDAKRMEIWFTPSEEKTVRKSASNAGLSLVEFVRRKSLGIVLGTFGG